MIKLLKYMKIYIYKFTNCNYIGSTKNIEKRTKYHTHHFYFSENKNWKLYKYIRKNNIKIELQVLYTFFTNCFTSLKLQFKLRRLVEQFYINKYDCINNGYNTRNAFTNKKKYKKEYDLENKDKLKEYHRKYKKNNKDKISKAKKEYYEKNKDKILKKEKKYKKDNKDKISKQKKEYYKKNKDKILKQKKEYYEKNKDKISKKNQKLQLK